MQYQNRWYDRVPEMAAAVSSLLDFPDDIQDALADGVNDLAEEAWKAYARRYPLKSLGSQKIRALYKSKQRLRGYDRLNTTHRSINSLSLVPQPLQPGIAQHVLAMAHAVEDLVSYCRRISRPAPLQDIRRYAKIYGLQGSAEAARWLAQLRQAMGAPAHPTSVVLAPTSIETIHENADGMRVDATRITGADLV